MTDEREQEKEIAAEIIGDADYRRLRLSPEPGHNYYLHLQDLRAALDQFAPLANGRLLDYGCGSSPYRSLFPVANYLRADYTPSAGIDYVVGEDQRINERDESFDFILSTQVLEHVRRPQDYLRECFRLLRPGGTLLLTTHGMMEEHGCPFDFRRWTADGLRDELIASGFEVTHLKKLTTNARAAGFLLRQHGKLLFPGRRTLFGWLHWFFFRRTQSYFAKMDRRLDRDFPDCTLVDASEPGHALYVALLAVATKPQ